MRTTLTLDDAIAKELKEIAWRTDRPFKEVVNETLRKGLRDKGKTGSRKRYRLTPSSLGRTKSGFDIDRALQLAEQL